jgi:hypothetical protein
VRAAGVDRQVIGQFGAAGGIGHGQRLLQVSAKQAPLS